MSLIYEWKVCQELCAPLHYTGCVGKVTFSCADTKIRILSDFLLIMVCDEGPNTSSENGIRPIITN